MSLSDVNVATVDRVPAGTAMRSIVVGFAT
jgi:hypothetical protein